MNSSIQTMTTTPSSSPAANGSGDADNDDGDQQLLLAKTLVIGVKLVFALLTIVSAGSLVYVTARSRNLHGPCNLLLAANSVCICLYCISFVNQFIAILVAGSQGISLRLCVSIQVLAIIGNYGQYAFFPLVALDRLIGVAFPFWKNLYLDAHQWAYLSVLFACGFGYGVVAFAVSAVQVFGERDKLLVICETGNGATSLFSNIGMGLVIASTVFYLLLWAMFKWKQRNNSSKNLPSIIQRDNDYTRRLLRSLMAMFLLELFGWSSNQLATKVLNWIGTDSTTRWFIKSGVGLLTQTTLILFAPALYLMSSEYRRAFCKQFGLNCAGFAGSSGQPPAFPQNAASTNTPVRTIHVAQRGQQQHSKITTNSPKPVFATRASGARNGGGDSSAARSLSVPAVVAVVAWK